MKADPSIQTRPVTSEARSMLVSPLQNQVLVGAGEIKMKGVGKALRTVTESVAMFKPVSN